MRGQRRALKRGGQFEITALGTDRYQHTEQEALRNYVSELLN